MIIAYVKSNYTIMDVQYLQMSSSDIYKQLLQHMIFEFPIILY